jgi:hypothetical protein
MVVNSVVEGKRYSAGIAEEAINAFARQAFEQYCCAVHQVRHMKKFSLPRKVFWWLDNKKGHHAGFFPAPR